MREIRVQIFVIFVIRSDDVHVFILSLSISELTASLFRKIEEIQRIAGRFFHFYSFDGEGATEEVTVWISIVK